MTRTFSSGEVLAQQIDRGQALQGGHVTAAGHDHVRLAALVVAGPVPDADAGGAVLDRLRPWSTTAARPAYGATITLMRSVAAQAALHDAQQRIGIRREVDQNEFGLLRHDRIVDESGALVRIAVMFLAPHVRGHQEVQR